MRFFFLFCIVAVVFGQDNEVTKKLNDQIYDSIKATLNQNFPNQEKRTECMIKDFREKNLASKFYSADLIVNPDNLAKGIQPYVDAANIKCATALLLSSSVY